MSKASWQILASLPDKDRQKLADCLSSSSFKELESICGVGRATLYRLLARATVLNVVGERQSLVFSALGDLLDYANPFRDIPWFTFTPYPDGNIYFRTEGVRLTPLSKVFDRNALLEVLSHFEIRPAYDTPRLLEELQQIKIKLELYRGSKHPVVRDYLQDLFRQLCEDLEALDQPATPC